MPTTFKEQQEILTSSQHQLAVWEALYRFLDENFVAHDGGQPKKAIATHDCLVQIVPEDVIENVLKTLAQDRIIPLQGAINSINNQEVVVMPATGEN